MSEVIQPSTLYVVSTPIGNLEDITLRALRVLGGVDLIAAEDTRKTRILLDHYQIEKDLLSYYSYNESKRVPALLDRLKEGKSIAVVTDAGTPGISDPAYVLMKACIDEGITVIPIPGASAVLPALIVSGLPTDGFIFEGFLPVKKGRRKIFERWKDEERTVVIYESPFRVIRTLEDILQHVGDRRIALVRELTKKFEEVVRGNISQVVEKTRSKACRGEYVIVLGGKERREDRD